MCLGAAIRALDVFGAHPRAQRVMLLLTRPKVEDRFVPTDRSALLDASVDDVAPQVEWPPVS